MRKLVGTAVVLAVVLGLAVAADFGAAAAAEHQVSIRMRSELSLPADPSVQIHGFPFATQAVGGDYSDVELSADHVSYGKLHDLSVRARLHGVHVPFSALFGGSLGTVPVDDAQGSVLIGPSDLAALVGVSELRVESVTAQRLAELRRAAAADPRGSSGNAAALSHVDPTRAVQLTGSAAVAGTQLQVAVIASVELVGGQVQITARDIRVGTGGGTNAPLPGPVQTALLKGFTTKVDPGRLPFHATPTGVSAVGGALAVSGVARDLLVNPAGGATG